jgi:hypothetical protein
VGLFLYRQRFRRCFIYIHRLAWYLSIDAEDRPDAIERPVRDAIDMTGWDIRKTLRLFRKSNPPLLEWLQCPIVYRERVSCGRMSHGWLRHLCRTHRENSRPSVAGLGRDDVCALVPFQMEQRNPSQIAVCRGIELLCETSREFGPEFRDTYRAAAEARVLLDAGHVEHESNTVYIVEEECGAYGTGVASCPSGSIGQNLFEDAEIFDEIEGVLAV